RRHLWPPPHRRAARRGRPNQAARDRGARPLVRARKCFPAGGARQPRAGEEGGGEVCRGVAGSDGEVVGAGALQIIPPRFQAPQRNSSAGTTSFVMMVRGSNPSCGTSKCLISLAFSKGRPLS